MSDPSQFVFRKDSEGKLKFVGDFEGLYRTSTDPWGQSANHDNAMSQYYTYSRTQLMGTVKRRICAAPRTAFTRGLEVGCGHGYVLNMLMTFSHLNWIGMDVSQSAVTQAKKLFPNYTFFVGDITRRRKFDFEMDVIVLGQLLWYVMHNMDAVMSNCFTLLRPGGLLIVSQAFLTGPQEYGNEIAQGFDGTLDMLLGYEGYQLVEARYEDNLKLAHHDGIFVLRRN